MNAAALAATSPRRAALLVHALPLADRDWLLASLAPHHRVELELLLDELRALEIPPDAALLREIVDAAPVAVPASTEAQLAQITEQQAAALAEMLRREPPQLVATLLEAGTWPWKAQVLAALGPHGTQARPRHDAALRDAICESVLRRLQACPPAPAAPVRRWARLVPIRFHRTATA